MDSQYVPSHTHPHTCTHLYKYYMTARRRCGEIYCGSWLRGILSRCQKYFISGDGTWERGDGAGEEKTDGVRKQDSKMTKELFYTSSSGLMNVSERERERESVHIYLYLYI